MVCRVPLRAGIRRSSSGDADRMEPWHTKETKDSQNIQKRKCLQMLNALQDHFSVLHIEHCFLTLVTTHCIMVFSYLYDMDYGRVTDTVLAHEDAITCLCFGQKLNVLVSGSSDCTVKLWKGLTSNGKIRPIQCLHKQIDHNSQVHCVSFDR